MDLRLVTLGARVRRRRRSLHLTQKQVAAKSGLSSRFIAQLEAGQGNISVVKLFAVAASLETTPSRLLEGLGKGRGTVSLIGLRGAGKSTVGKLLAKSLAVEFLEVDAEIENHAGLSLAQIFSTHGESYYRRLERQILAELVRDDTPRVLATGGSVVTDPESYGLLLDYTTVVWLRAEDRQHWNRVLAQGDSRPMADNPDAFAELQRLLQDREPEYSRAHVEIDTASAAAPEVNAMVLDHLRNAGFAC